MRVARLSVSILLATPVLTPAAAQDVPADTVLTAADGVRVHATWYRSPDTAGEPVILLFHQGGASGMAEYAPVIPRLREAGFNLLLIDQRRGGDRFGGINRTASSVDADGVSYCDVLPDLEAALVFARQLEPERRVILWGSSYSAALVFQLAVAYPEDVRGLLAFSPASGDPMDGCRPAPFAEQVQVPALVLRPTSEMERGGVATQMQVFRDQGHDTYVADPGAHGSSMLVADRVNGDVEATWEVVSAFLDGLRSGGARPGREGRSERARRVTAASVGASIRSRQVPWQRREPPQPSWETSVVIPSSDVSFSAALQGGL
jgi:pimeloyl-ACP methyl ester carboxylesterase